MSIVTLPPCFNNTWLNFKMNEDPLQTEGSSDSFQNFLAQALLPRADLPDVQRAEGSIDSPKSKSVASTQASGSDTGLRRDVLSGQAAAVNPNVEPHISHPSSAAGSEHTPSADLEPPRSRGRGRGRQRKRVSGQGETAQQRAHRRFYERKKQKLAALEQEAAEKLALYQRLHRENADLRRKYDALKCTIAGRDEQMNLLQAMSSLCINPAAQRAAAAPATPPAAALVPDLELPDVTTSLQRQQPLGTDSRYGVQPGSLPLAALPGVASSSAEVSLHRRTGSDLTGYSHSQGHLPRHVAAAGPFGTVQLRAQDTFAASADPPLYAWQQPVIKPDAQVTMAQLWPEQQQQQQQPMPQQVVPNLALTRSASTPARHHPSDRPYPLDPGAADSPAAGGQDIILQGQPVGKPPRAYSSSPLARQANPAFRPDGGSFNQQQQQVLSGWNAGPSRLQQTSLAAPRQQQAYHPQQQQQQQQGVAVRPHSWSGPASPTEGNMMAAPPALNRQSQSFPNATQPAYGSPTLQVLDPAMQLGAGQLQPGLTPFQQQQQQQQQHLLLSQGVDISVAVPSNLQLQPQRQGFHTITTAGPFPAQQQQLLGRSGSDPTAAMHSRQALLCQAQQQVAWQQQQQQQQQYAASVNLLVQQQVVLPALPPVQQQYGQQQQQQGADAQQQQQQGADAQPSLSQFGNLLSQSDDLMMLDDELMLLLDKELSQQVLPQQQQQQQQLAGEQSAGMLLSPLDSIPSAGAQFAPAHTSAGQPSDMPGTQQQLQQQPAFGGPGCSVPAATPPAVQTAPGSQPQTLLVASRLLQARHEAAGYFPAAATATGEADFCYVHQLVDWYRSKMHQLAELIPRVDRPAPDVAAGVALVQAVEELIMGCRKFGTRSRVGLWELGLINLETGDFEEAPPHHWRSVYHSLGFSAEIRGKLDGCWGLYKDYMRKAWEERQQVLREMAALQAELYGEAAAAGGGGAGPAESGPAIVEGSTTSGGAASGTGNCLSQQQWQDCPATLQFRRDGLDEWQAVFEKLQVSLQREHMVANMIMYSCAQVASHIQMARAMLNSYPYWPNGPAILAVLHEEEQLAAAAGRTAWPEPPSRMRSI